MASKNQSSHHDALENDQPVIAQHDQRIRLVAGCMTGTSLDGLDVALARIEGRGLELGVRCLGVASEPLPDALRSELRHFASGGSAPALRYLQAARQLGRLHAQVVERTCRKLGVARLDFVAAHGQTIWHSPQAREGLEGMSWQLFDPWPLVRTLGVSVCYDLRQADLMAGGQGAPITPLADWVLLRHPAERRLVVNLGGICNVTFVPPGGAEQVMGEDIGPCNLLIDALVQRLYPGLRFDEDGRLAKQGQAEPLIWERLMQSPFFDRPRPRSTGREDFTSAWLDALLSGPELQNLPSQDLVASACLAVARLVVRQAGSYAPTRLILAGGGAMNPVLVNMIREQGHSQGWKLNLADELGIPAAGREALEFAVLGALSQDGLAISLPQVTGALRPGRGGAWAYP